MWFVQLERPLPGVLSTVFVFDSEVEASEFGSAIFPRCAEHGISITQGKVGEITEVLPSLSPLVVVEHKTAKGWEIYAEHLNYHEACRIWGELLADGVECRLTATKSS